MSQAPVNSQLLSPRTGCCCIFINQLRERSSVMFGNPETTTGGNALKFYASVIVSDIRRIGQIKDGETVVGNRTRVKIVKQTGASFRTVEFDIVYGEGISKMGEIVDLGVDKGVILQVRILVQLHGETKLAQGRDAVKQLLLDNPELAEELEGKIRAAISSTEMPVEVE